MPVEAGGYISDLQEDWPLGTDPESDGDDHIRVVKKSVKATFPNANGPITGTPDEFNNLTAGMALTQADATTTSPAAWHLQDGAGNQACGISLTPTMEQTKANAALMMNFQALVNIFYPVGAVYMSATDTRNPADYLGFGTWSEVVGLVAGVGAAVDKNGMSGEFSLGAQSGSWRVGNDQIIAQSITPTGTVDSGGGHEHGNGVRGENADPFLHTSYGSGGSGKCMSDTSSSYSGTEYKTTNDGTHGHGVTGVRVAIGTGSATDGGVFVNPYYGMYIWVRTA
ncbi:phage baseplate protein [Kluyvera sp. CHPC 1.2972]|uniref:phage baseplate protein n=1 Tax=Kluyvera sp. CHPC 1.2972 TaxID=2995176 RepID=UPI002FD812FC